MSTKKIISFLFISAIACGSFVSCGDKKSESSKTAERKKFDNSVSADSGDAYLAIVDGNWYIQYWGKNDDEKTTMLSYDAGIAKITGNGDYTVSVTTDTPGFRYDTTGDENNNSVVPSGLEFMAVMIKDGEKLFPNAAITVNEIRVDGNAVEMSAKPYTSSDDGIETRANIYNQWLSKPSSDARCKDGALYDQDGKEIDICEEYAPSTVSPDDFKNWSNVEVDFTISGI